MNLLRPLKKLLFIAILLTSFEGSVAFAAVTFKEGAAGEALFVVNGTSQASITTSGDLVLAGVAKTVSQTWAAEYCDENGANCSTAADIAAAASAGALSLDDLTDVIHDTDDYSSLFIGNGAGANDDGSDRRNVAVGFNSMYTNASGSQNMAIGRESLYSNTTGSNNTVSGYYAMYDSTSGSDNAAYGVESLRYNTIGARNAAIGFAALSYNTTGNANTAVGYNAQNGQYSVTTGNYNVSLGYEANKLLSTGSNNIAIGSSVTVSDVNGDNQLNIGDTIFGDLANKKIQIGSTIRKDGGVLVGSSVDSHAGGLTVMSEDDQDALFVWVGNDNVHHIDANATGSSNLSLNQGGGAVGINTTNPQGRLNVVGDVRIGEITDNDAGVTGYGDKLIFSGGGDSTAFNSDNSDPLWLARFNVANNQSELRMNIGDDLSSVDRFAIGYTQVGTWYPHFIFLADGRASISDTTPDGTLLLDVEGQIGAAEYCDENGANCSTAADIAAAASAGALGLDDLTDVIHDTDDYSSLFIGNGAGVNDDGTSNQNVAVGYQAMTSNTSGAFNTAMGYQSMALNTSGASNVSYGFQSMYSNTTGGSNVAFGRKSLYSNTTGGSNVALGSWALYDNITGASNVATGSDALSKNTTGRYNVANGHRAIYYNTTGHSNLAGGYQAQVGAGSGSTGSYNVSLGYEANKALTLGNNNIAIGASVTVPDVEGNDQLNIGNIIKGLMTSGSEQVSLTGTLSVASICDEAGANCVDISAGFGGGGATSIDGLSDGVHSNASIYLGTNAGLYDDGGTNNNIGIGDNSLYGLWSSNKNGSYNTGVGNSTLAAADSAAYNVALGYQALNANATGNRNIGVGYLALGQAADASDNIGIGDEALYNVTTGHSNVAVGSRAHKSTFGTNSASYNISLGYEAGNNLSTGNNNITIGASATVADPSGDDQLNIGGIIKGLMTSGSEQVSLTGTLSVASVCDETGANCVDVSAGFGGGADWYALTNIPTGVEAISNTELDAFELTQLQNIDATTITTTQFGYLGGMDQGVASTDDVTFSTAYVSGNAYASKLGLGAAYTPSATLHIYGSSPYIKLNRPASSAGGAGIDITSTGVSPAYIALNNGVIETTPTNSSKIVFREGSTSDVDFSVDTGTGIVRVASKMAISDTTPDGTLLLDVEGQIGAAEYCDENGANCSTAADIAAAASAGTLSLDDLTDVIHDTDDYSSLFIGNGAGANDDGSDRRNVAVGYQSLFSNISGFKNVALGYQSMASNTTGERNVATGALALTSNISGLSNVANGVHSLLSNTTGSFNVAVGASSLYTNVDGTQNTAVGTSALNGNIDGGYNVAVGGASLLQNTSGNYNTAYGYRAGAYNTTGHSNLAQGYQAQYGVSGTSTGSYNVSLGYEANKLLTTGNNNIAIGASVSVVDPAGNDQLNIGGIIKGLMTSGSEQVSLTGTLSVASICDEAGANCVDVSAGFGGGGATSIDGLSDGVHSNASIYLGTNAGLYDDGGTNNNIGIGDNSLYGLWSSNKNGSYNTGVGNSTLAAADSAAYNVALGYQALNANATGNRNIGVGYLALGQAADASDNIGIGDEALYNVTTGHSNVAVGSRAHKSTFGTNSASYNVSLGYEAGNNLSSGNNNITIGASATVADPAGNDQLNIGNIIKGLMTSGSEQVSLTGTLSVASICDEAGVNCVDVSAGFGGGGATSLDGLSDAIHDSDDYSSLFLGNSAGANDDGTSNENIGIGYASLNSNTTGNRNIGIGYNALTTASTASENTAVGYNALYAATSSGNSAFGAWALYSETTGIENTALGYQAMHKTTDGGGNVSVGYQAAKESTGAYNNVSVGYGAGYYNLSGANNVAIGRLAMRGAAGYNYANNNVAVGFQSGYKIAGSMTDNTFIGYRAGYNQTAGTNNIAIGSAVDLSSTGGSNQLNIGNTIYGDLANGYIGIGTGAASLTEKLEVAGNIRIGDGRSFMAGAGSDLKLYHNGANSFVDNETGTLGIRGRANGGGIIFSGTNTGGTTATGMAVVAATDVRAVLYYNGNEKMTTVSTGVSVTGDVNYSGTLNDTSDRRLKTNIQAIEDGQLGNIEQINPVSFEMKDRLGETEFGVIAQDLEEIYPVLVHTADDEMGTKSVNYIGLIPMLVKAMQEQQAEIRALKAEVEALKASSSE